MDARKKKETLKNASLFEISNSDGNYKIIDFRAPDSYKKGHIPKAINIWRSDIINHDIEYDGINLHI